MPMWYSRRRIDASAQELKIESLCVAGSKATVAPAPCRHFHNSSGAIENVHALKQSDHRAPLGAFNSLAPTVSVFFTSSIGVAA